MGVLALVELIKRSIGRITERDLGILWWWLAWLLGGLAALTQGCGDDLGCLLRHGLVYGGAAIALYPASKRVLGRLRSAVGG
jgi:hypothetical protein